MKYMLLQTLALIVGCVLILQLLYKGFYLCVFLWFLCTIILLWQNRTAEIEIEKINKEYAERIK